MNITSRQIKSQYDRVKRDGWLPWFQAAARLQGDSTALFLAIGSRETNLKNIRGDFRGGKYHGFGVMQVDVGTDPEYAAHWTPDSVEPSIKRGAEIWDSKYVQVTQGQGKRLRVGSLAFTGREAEVDDVRRIATSAYNCGLWAYYHFSNHAQIDSSTTGKDYSRDVYDRALVFAELLEADGEAGAYAREIRLQGKHAAADEKAKVKEPLVTDTVTGTTKAKVAVEPETNLDDGTQTNSPASGAVSEPGAKEVKMSAMSTSSKTLTWTMISSAIMLALKEAWTSAKTETISASKYAVEHLPQTLLILGLAALGVFVYNAAMKRKDQRTNKIIDITADKSKNDVVIT